MLTHLRLKNFKAWRDTGPIRLAPLTVLFGANSSGKSSLHQFLLLLKQTAQSPDLQRVLHTGTPGAPYLAVDIGTFFDCIHGHATDATLQFELGWSLPDRLKIKDAKSDTEYSGNRFRFKGEIGPQDATSKTIITHSFKYRFGDMNDSGFSAGMEWKGENREYNLVAKNYTFIRNSGRPWPLPPPHHFYGFPDETLAYYQNAEVTKALTLELENCLRQIHYLGPLRDYPKRTYAWSGEYPAHVGFRGENVVAALLAAQSRQISSGKHQRQIPFQEAIARWLKKLDLIADFKVKSIDERLHKVSVRSPRQESWVMLPDVGLGVSQVLPVLVQCFYAPPGSTLIFEQPEIHLHPSVQARLADLFIEAVQARENGQDRGVQLLVESHSEHFLRRLQRRIAEQAIAPESVAIYFCSASRTGARLDPLDVDAFGHITNWPDNFFGNDMEDIAAMARAIAQRHKDDKVA